MTLIIPEQDDTRLEEERDGISETLEDLRQALTALQRKAVAGDIADKAEAGKVLADIRYWLKAARETEQELEQARRRDAGIARAYGLDLEAAMREVDCRLDRLRDCCGGTELS